MEDQQSHQQQEITKKRKWNECEETALIQYVVEREGDLFGEIKGVGTKKKSALKREGWEEISSILNSQFTTAKRDGEEIKKKYFNLKQRAKEKIDTIKRSMRQTGGGPAPPSLTPVEEAMAQSLEGRPVVEGIEGGIDTEEVVPQPASTNSALESPVSANNTASEKPLKPLKRKSRISDEIEQLTAENLKLDNRRLNLEIIKLEKETAKLSEEISFMNAKKIYYQLKIQSEFQLSLNEC